jgi:hypothetical protein
MTAESNLSIYFGVHARCPEVSRQAVKKLWAGDKGTVKSRRKETIARIGNSDKAKFSLMSARPNHFYSPEGVD